MHMPRAPASVFDRLEKLEQRLDNLETRLLPTHKVIVARFIMACLDPNDRAETSCVDIFHRYERWCREHYPLVKPLDIQAFNEQFAHFCKIAGLEMGRIDTLYCFGLAFVD
jgi:hypothetical protein